MVHACTRKSAIKPIGRITSPYRLATARFISRHTVRIRKRTLRQLAIAVVLLRTSRYQKLVRSELLKIERNVVSDTSSELIRDWWMGALRALRRFLLAFFARLQLFPSGRIRG